MSDHQTLRDGQIVTGPIFDEPMRVETVGPSGVDGPAPVSTRTLRLVGSITAEVWNRFGTRVIPKLRTGSDLKLGVDLSVMVDAQAARQLEMDLRQAIDDVGLTESVRVEKGTAD